MASQAYHGGCAAWLDGRFESRIRAGVVTDAFIKQMDEEGEKLRGAKFNLEKEIAEGGGNLVQATSDLDTANAAYRTASVQVRKHAAPAKPKAERKAKAKAEPKAAA